MEVKLGFGSIPKPQYVFVNRENDYCWYMLTEDKKHIPIYEKALTGVITEIEIKKTIETSFGEAEKTDLSVFADKPYIIRSGSDSYFSKSLLLSLDALSPAQLHNPLTIAVSPGDRKVVFCNIYDPVTYRSIGVSWDGYKEIDWQALGQKVSLKINRNQYSKPEQISTNIKESELHAVLIAESDTYLSQLHWSPEQGREYLQHKYGRRSRHHLSDTELLDFIKFLKLQLTQIMSSP
ncbi:MAG: hypothetical protein RMY34_00255 [Aulosira sp. DedQUE10]|nr:hypothetical protein [Aulosira sp. DedQUE10]